MSVLVPYRFYPLFKRLTWRWVRSATFTPDRRWARVEFRRRSR
jgi:hypothetical protein